MYSPCVRTEYKYKYKYCYKLQIHNLTNASSCEPLNYAWRRHYSNNLLLDFR